MSVINIDIDEDEEKEIIMIEKTTNTLSTLPSKTVTLTTRNVHSQPPSTRKRKMIFEEPGSEHPQIKELKSEALRYLLALSVSFETLRLFQSKKITNC